MSLANRYVVLNFGTWCWWCKGRHPYISRECRPILYALADAETGGAYWNGYRECTAGEYEVGIEQPPLRDVFARARKSAEVPA